jgi:hypothetical protein
VQSYYNFFEKQQYHLFFKKKQPYLKKKTIFAPRVGKVEVEANWDSLHKLKQKGS